MADACYVQTSVLRDFGGCAPFAALAAAVFASAERADFPARLPRRMKVGLGLRSASGDTGTASILWNLAGEFNLAEAKGQFL